MLPLLLLMSISVINPLSRQFIMQLMLYLLNLSSLPSDVVSIRLPIFQEYQKSSSSLTLFIWQNSFSTILSTLLKYTWLPFPKNLGSFSSWTMTIWSILENILVVTIGLSSNSSIETQNNFIKHLCSPANYCGTLARKESVMTLFESGKWCSRLQIRSVSSF